MKAPISCLLLALLAALPVAAQGDPNACDEPGEFPDVIVGDLPQVQFWGTDGTVSAYSVATTSCNDGTCQVTWNRETPDHPVIAQNMYRLKDGRFEQIGQSWLKHGFFAVSGKLCYDDCVGTDGSVLGVHCSDPYSANFNGDQATLGPRFEVDPATGVFPFPHTARGETGGLLYKRLQVRNDDLDPALNAGALYFVEGHYINEDDATAGTDENNASHRPVEVTAQNGAFLVGVTGETVRTLSAIHAWAAQVPGVDLASADVPDDGRLTVGAAVVPLGGGRHRYEYAVHNLNSHRAGGSFTVRLPYGATVENAGFHDVAYHSGEPFDGTDWTIEVSRGRNGDLVRWSTDPFDLNPDANALRWGTVYNFWFESDAPPGAGDVTLGLFRPGSPASVVWTTHAPDVCDEDGACEPGETCGNCAADCLGQAEACCGDGVCEIDETPCGCPADCGPVFATEQICDDGLDLDCDGLADCFDPDCCGSAACDEGVDADDDGFAGCDCDDGNPASWSPPGEVADLRLDHGPAGTSLAWTPPAEIGGDALTFDVVRSDAPFDFVVGAACVATDAALPSAADPETPAPGGGFHYLVRAENGCPAPGSIGKSSADEDRLARACP